MTPTAYQALAVHVRSIALRDAYLAFLADCIAECDRKHSPEELAAAEAHLRRPVEVAQFDLLLGKS